MTPRYRRAMSLRIPALLVLVLPCALAMTPGCASGSSMLRRRAASDLGCDASRVHVASLGAGGYRASGCGRARTYTCVNATCIGDSEVTSIPASAGRATTPGDLLVQRTWEAMRACLGESDGDLTLDVAIDEYGSIRPIEIHERVGPHEASCISRVARDASDAAWASAVRLTLVFPAERPPPAAPLESPQEITAVPSEQPAPSPRASEPPDLRARVDARGAAIVACVGDVEVVPLVVEWTAEGTVTAHVRGREGSAEEACVQALLDGERLDPPPGATGTLVHVVEAR